MAFGDFSLKDVKTRFGLSTVEGADVFASVPPIEPGSRLREHLDEFTRLAIAVNTEKIKSELLVAPVLAEVWVRLRSRVALFSGTEFPADPSNGLNGFCDYVLCRSAEQQFISAPVMMIAEAKNDAPKNGLGQCAAAMVGARIFNEREGTSTPIIYGAATTGVLWQFLKLEGSELFIDDPEYHISQVARILGVLHYVMTDPASTSSG